MKALTPKHWITFSILSIYNIATLTFITGTVISVLSILLPLLLIHYFLREPLTTYGLHFKKIHIQIISAVFLTFVILFLIFSNSVSWEQFIFQSKYFMERFPSFFHAFEYFFVSLIYAIPEEIFFRGFYLTFFQKLFNNSFVSIFLCAILFGVSHYPRHQNIQQVIFSCISGLIYGYLRIKEPEKFTIFSLSFAHFLHNIFVDLLTL